VIAEEAVSPAALIVVLVVFAVIVAGGIFAVCSAAKLRAQTDPPPKPGTERKN
jgi:hypothetical protein